MHNTEGVENVKHENAAQSCEGEKYGTWKCEKHSVWKVRRCVNKAICVRAGTAPRFWRWSVFVTSTFCVPGDIKQNIAQFSLV